MNQESITGAAIVYSREPGGQILILPLASDHSELHKDGWTPVKMIDPIFKLLSLWKERDNEEHCMEIINNLNE